MTSVRDGEFIPNVILSTSSQETSRDTDMQREGIG